MNAGAEANSKENQRGLREAHSIRRSDANTSSWGSNWSQWVSVLAARAPARCRFRRYGNFDDFIRPARGRFWWSAGSASSSGAHRRLRLLRRLFPRKEGSASALVGPRDATQRGQPECRAHDQPQSFARGAVQTALREPVLWRWKVRAGVQVRVPAQGEKRAAALRLREPKGESSAAAGPPV